MRFLVLLLLLSSIVLADAAEWTLPEVIEQALNNNHRLAAGVAQVSASQASFREDQAARFGTVDIGGVYQHSSEVQQLSIALPIPGLTFPSVKFGDGNVYDFTATAKVPLYTGGALTNRMNASRHALNAAQFDLSADSAVYVNEVRKIFFQTYAAKLAWQLAGENRERVQRHAVDVTNMNQVGVASEEMKRQAESALEVARQNEIAADSDYRSAMLMLGNYIGYSEPVEPSCNLAESILTDSDLSLANSGGFVRSEVAALSSRIEQANAQTQVVKATWQPTLAVNGVYHYAKPGIDAIKNKWMTYTTYGVALSWTLWDFSQRSYRFERSQAMAKQLSERRVDLERTLATALRVANTKRAFTLTILSSAEKRLEHETVRNELVAERWKLGQIGESEWQDAETEFSLARLNRVNAQLKLRLVETDILAALGKH